MSDGIRRKRPERGARMPGYKHPCRYCDKLIPPDSNVCPFCSKINPLLLRCPKCKDLIEKGWKNFSSPARCAYARSVEGLCNSRRLSSPIAKVNG